MNSGRSQGEDTNQPRFIQILTHLTNTWLSNSPGHSSAPSILLLADFNIHIDTTELLDMLQPHSTHHFTTHNQWTRPRPGPTSQSPTTSLTLQHPFPWYRVHLSLILTNLSHWKTRTVSLVHAWTLSSEILETTTRAALQESRSNTTHKTLSSNSKTLLTLHLLTWPHPVQFC